MRTALELLILGFTLSEYEIEILFVALGIDCATRNNDVQLLDNATCPFPWPKAVYSAHPKGSI